MERVTPPPGPPPRGGEPPRVRARRLDERAAGAGPRRLDPAPWPATAALGPQQWSVDPASGHLVCDGKGGHEWLRLDRRAGRRGLPRRVALHARRGRGQVQQRRLRAHRDRPLRLAPGPGRSRGRLPLRRDPGGRRGEARRAGARRGARAAPRRVEHLRARGPREALSLWVNGAFTSEIAIDVPRGHFGLEAEGWRIEFRNLKVKPLD